MKITFYQITRTLILNAENIKRETFFPSSNCSLPIEGYIAVILSQLTQSKHVLLLWIAFSKMLAPLEKQVLTEWRVTTASEVLRGNLGAPLSSQSLLLCDDEVQKSLFVMMITTVLFTTVLCVVLKKHTCSSDLTTGQQAGRYNNIL